METSVILKVNKKNKDIWALIVTAIESKNIALIEKNLKRLYALQAWYIDLINQQQLEINGLKIELMADRILTEAREKEFIIEVAKRNGVYERLKEDIDRTFNG